MRSIHMVQLIASAVAAGIPLESLPVPQRKHARHITEVDNQRIEAAQAKRDRKAAKRASKQGD